jgi:hypothetical protein
VALMNYRQIIVAHLHPEMRQVHGKWEHVRAQRDVTRSALSLGCTTEIYCVGCPDKCPPIQYRAGS